MFIDVHREDGTFVLGSFSIRLSIALPVHFEFYFTLSIITIVAIPVWYYISVQASLPHVIQCGDFNLWRRLQLSRIDKAKFGFVY